MDNSEWVTLPRYGRPERYEGKTVSEVQVMKTHHGEDRLVIRFNETDDYLDIRADTLYY